MIQQCPRYLLKWAKNYCLYKNLCMDTYHSFFHNCPKLEEIKTDLHGWINWDSQTKILFITLKIVATEIQGGNLKSYYKVVESQSENPKVWFQEHGTHFRKGKLWKSEIDRTGLAHEWQSTNFWGQWNGHLILQSLTQEVYHLGSVFYSLWTCSENHVSEGSHWFQQGVLTRGRWGEGRQATLLFSILSQMPKSEYLKKKKKVSQMPLLYGKYSFFYFETGF